MEWGDHLLPPVEHQPPTDDHRWQGIVLRAASDILDELEAEHEADRAERRAVLAEAAAITRYPLDD